jgi:hypothetical protein
LVSAERNNELARRAIGIWSTGDVDDADEICGPDYVNHQHHAPDDPRDLRSDPVRFQRAAAIAEVDVTLSVGAHMQHIYPIYCGAMPEADAAVVMIWAWIRTRLS